MCSQLTTVFPGIVYKHSNGSDYHVDVSLPSGEKFPVPLLVFYHGGGLVSGTREENPLFPAWIKKEALEAGIAFASADYTLLTPQDGHVLIEDVIDLFSFIRNSLNTELKIRGLVGPGIDTQTVFAAGASAGGFMAYLAGLYVEPKPKAIVSLYGMGGDWLLDDWFTQKTEPFAMGGKFPIVRSTKEFQQVLDTSSSRPPTTNSAFNGERFTYMIWLIQEARMLQVVFGEPDMVESLKRLPRNDRAGRVSSRAKRLMPALVADSSFPPTYLIHGDRDVVISVNESRSFEKVLARLGVEHLYREVEGADHGLIGAPVPPSSYKAIEFLLKHC
ncbi:alpha/beta-hydrolase [Meredithblackwellia eburnea MCA 4105]